MASITLDFLNKNMYRKYPIRATSSHVFTDSVELPQSLITSAQITTTYNHKNIYIYKIYAKNGYVSVLIRDYDDDTVLGSFSGYVTGNQSALTLAPSVKNLSGAITIGDITAIAAVNGAHYLTPDDGRLEDSSIFCFTPPAVRSILNKTKIATGNITLKGGNLNLTSISHTVNISVVNRSIIMSKNDFGGSLNNCLTPVIAYINSVQPNSLGNIDVFGIDPVKISVSSGHIVISTPDLDLNTVCPEKKKLAPPFSTDESYYTDISTTHTPEWKSWPEFS
jgi:hypothetical protein